MFKKKNPKKFILDVDGVLNDGKFYYSEKGKILKQFGPHDHDGIKLLKNLIKIEFYTADERGLRISERRINDMGFSLQLVKEQKRFKMICEDQDPKEIIYMGDGLNDAIILKTVLCGICPKSARIEAIKCADFVTRSEAGNGAVLDAAIFIKKNFYGKR